MVAVLGDGVVFHCAAGSSDATKLLPRGVAAEYMEEVPIAYFNKQHAGLPFVSFPALEMVASNRTSSSVHPDGGMRAVQYQQHSAVRLLTMHPTYDVTPPKAAHD